MNTTKISSYGKLIAFFLVIVILLSTFVIAAGGWQISNDDPDNDNPTNDNNDITDNDANDSKEPSNDGDEITQLPPSSPKYYDFITGTEIEEEISTRQQFAYVIDSNSPLCGISGCSLLVEFPIENNSTRFLMFNNRSLIYNKIGSITYSRKYIDNIAHAFGATVVSLSNDDTIDYNYVNHGKSNVELMKINGSYYNEYTYFHYTSPSLFNQTANDVYTSEQSTLPYILTGVDEKTKIGSISASTVNVPYSNSTSLIFSKDTNKYVLTKSNSDRIDVYSSEKVSFDNAFILFSDSMTYETAFSTQTILSTLGSGQGYYIQNGYAEEITWCLSENGDMTFYNSSGTKLTVNRGSSYMAFVKSSNMSSVVFG